MKISNKCYIILTTKYDGNFYKDKSSLVKLIKQKIENNEDNSSKIKELNKKIFSYVNKAQSELKTIFSKPLIKQIGSGQDNLVYEYNNNWVIKILYNKVFHNKENIYQYFVNKYHILKKYFAEFIPDSYFFSGETINPNPLTYKNLKEFKIKYPTIYTVQRKIQGYTLTDLPADIRKNKNLLNQLKSIHKKYLQLKLYIHFLERKNFKRIGIVDFKSDLGEISKKTKIDDIILSFKTPNIMWDIHKNKLFLIDFDSGSYNQEVEVIFNQLLQDKPEKVISKGEKLLTDFSKNYQKLTKNNLINFFSKKDSS